MITTEMVKGLMAENEQLRARNLEGCQHIDALCAEVLKLVAVLEAATVRREQLEKQVKDQARQLQGVYRG